MSLVLTSTNILFVVCSGLIVHATNYLDVLPEERWVASFLELPPQ